MTTADDLQRFIDAAARCRYPGELRPLLDEHTRRLGFDYFALVHHVDLSEPEPGGVVAIWSYPAAWADEYIACRLATTDPVHLASHRINIGFTWDRVPDLIDPTPAHRRVRERTRRAGIEDGYTVPANIPGEANGSCTFAVATGHALPYHSFQAAQLLGGFAFHAARRVSHRNGTVLVEHPRLSPRQIDCLVLIGRGASDREAAQQLGIAEDTVTEYLDEARHRYGVSRRTTLVLRAIFDGQIALSDVLANTPL